MAKIPLVVLMCGVAGSGKTTYARKLEAAGYVRLSVDEEMWRQDQALASQFGTPEYFDFTVAVEKQLRERLVELIAAGRDAVVDLSFWSKKRREEYRSLISEHGGRWQLVYLECPRDELLRRLELRGQQPGPNSAPVDPAYLDKFIAGFEVPHGEGETVVRG